MVRGLLFSELREDLRGCGLELDDLAILTTLVGATNLPNKKYRQIRHRLENERARDIADVLVTPKDRRSSDVFPVWAIFAAIRIEAWHRNCQTVQTTRRSSRALSRRKS